MNKTTSLPDGFHEQSSEWHLTRFTEFTKFKMEIGEPSPHLTVLGHMSKECETYERLWRLGLYAATYCLPMAQVIWTNWSNERAQKEPQELDQWLKTNWDGVVLRKERRCILNAKYLSECLFSYQAWMYKEYPRLLKLKNKGLHPDRYYDKVWESVMDPNTKPKYLGRYINIRLIEGLRRYCDIPASLYDIRSIDTNAWSPKKGLCFLYQQYAKDLIVDNKAGNELTTRLADELYETVKKQIPNLTKYIIAAMLCEYKGAFEGRHQYPGWTIDQEPGLYSKVLKYWGDGIDQDVLWSARKKLFPNECLGEIHGWGDTRHDCARMLRDYGIVWSDKIYNFKETFKNGDFSKPVVRI